MGDHAETAHCDEIRSAIRGGLAGVKYPFEHANQGIDLAGYVCPKTPKKRDVPECMGAAGDAFNGVLRMKHRIIARLARLGEDAEARAGLGNLPAPPQKDPESGSPEARVT